MSAWNRDMAYIGVRPCGCATFVTLLDFGTVDELAEDVDQVIRSGRRIECVSTDEAKARLVLECPHD